VESDKGFDGIFLTVTKSSLNGINGSVDEKDEREREKNEIGY
jgi:hypothetical protein